MSPEAEYARLKWQIATQRFWSGTATHEELEDAEDAYMEALGGNFWTQGADDAA